MANRTDVIKQYSAKAAKVNLSGLGTAETSFYPPLEALLSPIGQSLSPQPLDVISQISVRTSDTLASIYPDFGFIEPNSQVVALPVEVKPATHPITKIAITQQTKKYAKKFGGIVLITNLWQFALAETNELGEVYINPQRIVNLAEGSNDFFSTQIRPDLDNFWDEIQDLVRRGTIRKGILNSAEDVATLLAYHARRMTTAIDKAPEKPEVLFRDLKEVLHTGLQVELSGVHLTPTVVQTLVYGVFASWLDSAEPADFQWMRSSYTVTVPVFAELLHEALKPNVLRACDLTQYLDDVQMVLRWTDRASFTSGFDGDAIQYFYEPFLAQFDETLRKDLGVWYTPQEIANYQVRRTHHQIIAELGIEEGLADDSVYVLDPAVGTGTYIISCFDFLVDYFESTGETEGQAILRARDAVLKRIIGFEVLPAAFIICHLHISRHIQNAGADLHDARLRVYLTNSLTGWEAESAPDSATLFPELFEELRSASEVKHIVPVVAVIGNPPYEGYSTAETAEEQRLMKPLSAATTHTWNIRKHRLNDLYLRFWLVATQRIVDITGRGVVSFITNRKWLGGRSYPAFREHLVEKYDSLYVDDLHGGYHEPSRTEDDQSIFTTSISSGIRIGTAIVTATKNVEHSGTPAIVRLSDIWGRSKSKRNILNSRAAGDAQADYTQIEVSKRSKFRFTAPEGTDAPQIDEYFDFFLSGVQSTRDELVMGIHADEVETRMRDYFDPTLTFEDITRLYPAVEVKRSSYDARKVRSKLVASNMPSNFSQKRVVPVLYKPFDRRYLYWELRQGLLNRPRRDLAPYFSISKQVSLVLPQTPRRTDAARPVPSTMVSTNESTDPNSRIIPLYKPDAAETGGLFSDNLHEGATTVKREWEQAAQQILNMDSGVEAAEAVFYSIVAITHSPKWLRTKNFEHDDFPDVPLPADRTALIRASRVGRRITELYDVNQPNISGVTVGTKSVPLLPEVRGIADFDDVGDRTVSVKGTFGSHGGIRSGTDVLWSEDGGWRNVPDRVWEFTAGGFRVLPKWLSYRTESGLDKESRFEFRAIARRIASLIALESTCDELFMSAFESPLDLPFS